MAVGGENATSNDELAEVEVLGDVRFLANQLGLVHLILEDIGLAFPYLRDRVCSDIAPSPINAWTSATRSWTRVSESPRQR